MFSANVNRMNSKTNIHFKKHKAKPTAMDEYNFRIKISSQAVFFLIWLLLNLDEKLWTSGKKEDSQQLSDCMLKPRCRILYGVSAKQNSPSVGLFTRH